jgi:hypothetical protein
VKPRNPWLIAGGCLSLLAALLHIAIIGGGPDWYRFFGAGEQMARMAERGMWSPALITIAIATILAVWAAYAFAGAGLIGRLPLIRTALIVISAIYLLRAFLFPIMALQTHGLSTFNIWSSTIVLIYGLAYAIGTWQAWPYLSKRTAS